MQKVSHYILYVVLAVFTTAGCIDDPTDTEFEGPACEPKTCDELTEQCGSFDDGCGTQLQCGCADGYTCSDGECVCEQTQEQFCQAQGEGSCGQIAGRNACDELVEFYCGGCPDNYSCGDNNRCCLSLTGGSCL